MATALLDGNVTDQNGVSVPGALVYIRDPSTGGLADITDALGQPATNPITTGEDGYWSAHAATDQFYTLEYYWGGRLRQRDANVRLGEIGINTDPNVRPDLASTASGKGAALVGFVHSFGGAVDRTVEAKLRDVVSILDFGAVGDGATDNTEAFAAAAAYAEALPGGCTITFPAGNYNYDTSPNWAIPLLEMRCSSGVAFYHTGSGVAFNLDGGATGDGVYYFKLTGKPMIVGNADTTYGMDLRAIHTSQISAVLRNATTALLRTRWAVCDTFDIAASGLAFGGFSPQPTNCVVLDERGTGEQTSACTFTNMRLSHASDAALLLTSAIQNTFLGGAAEISDGAISIGANSTQNTILNFDMEVNTSYDLTCAGSRNTFINLYSDSLSVVGGDSNNFVAGIFNAITINGGADANSFWGVAYAANAGLFTDNGTRTGKLKIRNQTTGDFDNDIFTLPTDTWLLDADGAQRLYFASANTNYYKATLNHIFRDNTDAELAEIKASGVDVPAGKGFSVNSQQVVGGRLSALPADATDLASALTLVNAIKARLKTTGGHGLVAD